MRKEPPLTFKEPVSLSLPRHPPWVAGISLLQTERLGACSVRPLSRPHLYGGTYQGSSERRSSVR